MRAKYGQFAVMASLFILLGFGATASCRDYRINQCEESGGTAVVPPWFSDDPAAVACLKEQR